MSKNPKEDIILVNKLEEELSRKNTKIVLMKRIWVKINFMIEQADNEELGRLEKVLHGFRTIRGEFGERCGNTFDGVACERHQRLSGIYDDGPSTDNNNNDNETK